jgi:hypothetical protein
VGADAEQQGQRKPRKKKPSKHGGRGKAGADHFDADCDHCVYLRDMRQRYAAQAQAEVQTPASEQR